jgi:hypothetical protein
MNCLEMSSNQSYNIGEDASSMMTVWMTVTDASAASSIGFY